MSRCHCCGTDVGDPDVGDQSKGGTPVGIGMVLCDDCRDAENERVTEALRAKADDDRNHQFTISFAGTTVRCDDRDDEDY